METSIPTADFFKRVDWELEATADLEAALEKVVPSDERCIYDINSRHAPSMAPHPQLTMGNINGGFKQVITVVPSSKVGGNVTATCLPGTYSVLMFGGNNQGSFHGLTKEEAEEHVRDYQQIFGRTDGIIGVSIIPSMVGRDGYFDWLPGRYDLLMVNGDRVYCVNSITAEKAVATAKHFRGRHFWRFSNAGEQQILENKAWYDGSRAEFFKQMDDAAS